MAVDELLQRLGVDEDGTLFHDKKGRPVALPSAPAPLADSHGHLTGFLGHDAPAVLVRAALAGLRLLVVPVDPVDEIPRRWGSAGELLGWIDAQVDEARSLLDACAGRGILPPDVPGHEGLPSLLDNLRIVAGAHPYGAAELDAATLARLDELLASPRAVGVGEIGFDLGPYNELPVDVQERAFRLQLELARERELPVELHIRDGAQDTLAHELAARVLAERGLPAAGCDLHCFTQGPEVMAPFVELGCHVAFGGAVTFGRSDDIRTAATSCPEELLLSETDAPYMAPVPLRGLRCEPAMVAFSADCVARVREEADVASRARSYEAMLRNAFGLLVPSARYRA